MRNSQEKSALAQKAIMHTEQMANIYKNEITACVNNTLIFGGPDLQPQPFVQGNRGHQQVTPLTTGEAIFKLGTQFGKICVLNFASFRHPGGRFLDGSKAQEEMICHDSYLYNVLAQLQGYYDWNEEHKNNGMYVDRALYTPNVRFFDNNGNSLLADVITCAAPNRSLLIRYNMFNEEDNLKTLANRILFIRNIICMFDCPTIILGAWGCGVFKQDASTVAKLFMISFEYTGKNIAYAVPMDENYYKFEEVGKNFE